MKSIILFFATTATFGMYYAITSGAAATKPAAAHFHHSSELEQITWHDLDCLTYKDVYLDSLDAWFWQPIFDSCLIDIDGQEVFIAGFLQNMSTKEEPYFLLSQHKHMHRGCCGSSGPEDMIDLGKSFDPSDFEVEDSVVVTGTFCLNADDVYQLNYRMANSQLVTN